jgi:hypothetical protein
MRKNQAHGWLFTKNLQIRREQTWKAASAKWEF